MLRMDLFRSLTLSIILSVLILANGDASPSRPKFRLNEKIPPDAPSPLLTPPPPPPLPPPPPPPPPSPPLPTSPPKSPHHGPPSFSHRPNPFQTPMHSHHLHPFPSHFLSHPDQSPVPPDPFPPLPVSSPRPQESRVPGVPGHLPLDLKNRLEEFPTLATSLERSSIRTSMHTFFEPLVKVEAEELSDEEWHQYLTEEWQANGIVPELMPSPPPNVVNLDFGDHNCVHLGNHLSPAETRHPPKRLNFPGFEGLEYTVLLVDLDTKVKGQGVNLNWMKVNVPFDRPHKGTEVVVYEGPRPSQSSGRHRYALLVYLQKAHLDPGAPGVPRAVACQAEPRAINDLETLVRRLGLRGPVAGNYFLASWDVTVEHSCT